MTIKIKYKPRRWFMRFHMRRTRWAVLVAHRRAGKTVAAVNDLIERASRNPLENPRYAYIAPFLKQARDIAWMYLKEAAAPFNPKISESGLYVELTALPNSPRITLYGADNPDSFRGLYFDGVVLDEFGNMTDIVFKEILLPALTDRRGWAVFMGTPNGPNHFREMFYERKNDPGWFVEHLPVSITRAIREEDLAEMKKLMDEEQYAQEMQCSFEASVRGAIYARQMEAMVEESRIGVFHFDPVTPVDVIMDLGWDDLTVQGFVQQRPDGLLMGHVYADRLQPISTYTKHAREYITAKKLRLGNIWLPHDAKATSLQTGQSMAQQVMRQMGQRPKIVTDMALLDGIAITRRGCQFWYVNEPECEKFIMAMKSYHRKYDDELKTFSHEPVHDWSSNYADMFRYANIACKLPSLEEFIKRRGSAFAPNPARTAHYGFSLNELWDTAPPKFHSRRV